MLKGLNNMFLELRVRAGSSTANENLRDGEEKNEEAACFGRAIPSSRLPTEKVKVWPGKIYLALAKGARQTRARRIERERQSVLRDLLTDGSPD